MVRLVLLQVVERGIGGFLEQALHTNEEDGLKLVYRVALQKLIGKLVSLILKQRDLALSEDGVEVLL